MPSSLLRLRHRKPGRLPGLEGEMLRRSTAVKTIVSMVPIGFTNRRWRDMTIVKMREIR